jgi:hypothetical protein
LISIRAVSTTMRVGRGGQIENGTMERRSSMMFDSSAYHGQPGVMSSPFAPQGLFGQLPGQLGQPIWPTLGGVLGNPQLAACLASALLGYAPGQYSAAAWPTIAGALGHSHLGGVPPVYPHTQSSPFIGTMLGQPLFAGPIGAGVPFGRTPFEAALATIAAQTLAPQIAGWLQQAQLASVMGRSGITPFQTAVPQMAYAGY